MLPEVLDPCCGGRMMWFNKNDSRALFCDERSESHTLCDGRVFKVAPDREVDFKSLPFNDNSFSLICFDPPHLIRAGEKSWLLKKYGRLGKDSWQGDLAAGFSECWRVLKAPGTLVFKWNETQIKLNDVLNCFPQKPLFGHTSGRSTHWMTFFKYGQEYSVPTKTSREVL